MARVCLQDRIPRERKLHRERALDMCRRLPSSCQMSIHACEVTTNAQKRNHLEGLEEAITRPQTGP